MHTSKLRTMIMFNLAKELNKHHCFRCGVEILTAKEFSVDHKIPYRHASNQEELYWSMDNIAFAHLRCNILAGRRNKGKPKHTPESKEAIRQMRLGRKMSQETKDKISQSGKRRFANGVPRSSINGKFTSVV